MTASSEILNAVKFAADSHRNQRRKDVEASPYIDHPIQVGDLIARIGKIDDIVVLVAAILHDTVEDTETTFDDLESEFGRPVRDLVAEVTDDKALPKSERMKRQIDHTAKLTSRAKPIKLADKTCNVRDVAHSPPNDWDIQRRSEYLTSARRVVEGCRGTNANLEQYFDEIARLAEKALGVSR